MSRHSFSPSARAIRQRNNPPGSALMCSRLSLRKGYSGETSSESFSKSSLLRIITFVTSKTPGTQLAFFLRRLSSVLASAANAAYCFSFSLLHLKFLEISLCSSRKRGGWGSPQMRLDIQTLCLRFQVPSGKTNQRALSSAGPLILARPSRVVQIRFLFSA